MTRRRFVDVIFVDEELYMRREFFFISFSESTMAIG